MRCVQAGVLGCAVHEAPTLSCAFRWGHVRQLDRDEPPVAGPGMAAGAGPVSPLLTWTPPSASLRAKDAARHHGYTVFLAITRCWPLPPVVVLLMFRLREGQANTVPLDTSCGSGGTGTLRRSQGMTLRADSGFYTHAIVAVMPPDGCPLLRCQHASLRNLIEAIPETDWIPYLMDGASAVAETTYTPFQSEADAAPVLLIVRLVMPTPGSQLALFATYSYHGFITDRGRRNPGAGGRSPPPRRGRERHTRPQVRRRAEPHAVRPFCRQRRLSGGSGDGA